MNCAKARPVITKVTHRQKTQADTYIHRNGHAHSRNLADLPKIDINTNTDTDVFFQTSTDTNRPLNYQYRNSSKKNRVPPLSN